MSQFIETIKLLDGKLQNLPYHQMRLEKTRLQVLGLKKHPHLEEVIRIPGGLEQGLFKCRVTYGNIIDLIEFEPYARRVVKSLKLIESNIVEYGYKYLDRTALDALYLQRGSCDDILIVKQGSISDSYYANVIFWDGSRWFTPDTPLLQGTMRAFLLADGTLTSCRITPDDLGKFKQARLINAMNGVTEGHDIPIGALKY